MTARDRRRPEETETLIEAATTAFRERDPASGRILPSPAWWDLSPADRERLFARQLVSRAVESAIDDDGLSSTARAVLDRVPGVEQIGRE
jgi:hypothetical protein